MSSLIDRKGTWYLTYYIDGKQRWKSLKTSDKRTAKTLQNRFEAEFDQVKAGVSVGKVAIEESFMTFLNRKAVTVKPFTKIRYTQLSTNLINFCRAQGIKNVNDLQSRHAVEYISFRKGIASKTIKEELQALKAVIRMLIEDGFLNDSPIKNWPKIKVTTASPERVGHYTYPEVEKLKGYLKDHEANDAIMFLLYTGCRKGEMGELCVGDIDLEDKAIRLENHKTATKGSNQFRWVEIHDGVAEILKKRCLDKKSTDLVFPEVAANAPAWLTKIIKKACKVAGVPYKRLHGLRHTFISSLLNENVPVRHVQAMVGHNNISTTMRYSHITNEELRGKIGKLGY